MRDKNKPAAVPCSQCGQDIAYFLPSAKMGMCDTCKKLYCGYCLRNMKRNKCPSCKSKLIITKRVKQYPPGYGPQPIQQPVIIVQNMQPQNMIACDRCGTVNNAEHDYCSACGRRL